MKGSLQVDGKLGRATTLVSVEGAAARLAWSRAPSAERLHLVVQYNLVDVRRPRSGRRQTMHVIVRTSDSTPCVKSRPIVCCA
jgi:hypothetical protein